METRLDTDAARLQIAFAKVAWTEDERAAAETFARGVAFWDPLIETAARNFSLPNMYMHVASMSPGSVPEDVLETLRNAAAASALRNMVLISAKRRFQETCLAPLEVPAVFFKGISLVAQFYPDLGLRPCRDIDVLVPPGTLPAIVRQAVEHGYQFVIPGQAANPLQDDADVDAALHYRDDASLLSPDGMAIDLQVKLDKFSGIFEAEDIFANAIAMKLGGSEFLTLPPALLFNYLCHHHARHVWSRLHWLSDLDAMISSEHFDPREARVLATRLGQRGTVDAAFELQKLMSPLASWEKSARNWRGLKFLDLALRNLKGDLDLEKRIGFDMIGGEFMYRWQAEPRLIRRAQWRRWRKVLNPTIRQYSRYPLPRGLRWFYVFPRFVHVVLRARDRSRKELE